jgi:hypothetical protein
MKHINWLVSFPRSGSTWLRQFFERYTGLSSRSVYEEFNWDRPVYFETDIPCLYRTHTTDLILHNFPTRTLFLIRNPLDVIASQIKYHGKEYSDDNVVDCAKQYVKFLIDYLDYEHPKLLVKYEWLRESFTPHIIKILRFYEMEVSLSRIENFVTFNEQIFNDYLKYFSKYLPEENISQDMNTDTRRNLLTDKQHELIWEILFEQPKVFNIVREYVKGG